MTKHMIEKDGLPVWCPYPGCGFVGHTEDEVDDHRAENHRDEAQQGSNLRHRPRELSDGAMEALGLSEEEKE